MAVIVYEGSEDWSAIYLDGKLVHVGDHYLADEWVRSHFGVETRQSNAFMQGGDQRSDVAETIEMAEAYENKVQEGAEKAAKLREEALRLIAEAKRLERLA